MALRSVLSDLSDPFIVGQYSIDYSKIYGIVAIINHETALLERIIPPRCI